MKNDLDKDIDLSVIQYNLSITPEERLINHQLAFETLQEILKAREELYAKSEHPTQDPARK
ncbi:MAG: hypothetical protein SGI74_09560 [Oligoflexia bacterium]|nr:hypothetical protein [Oligoflexia bacterium]